MMKWKTRTETTNIGILELGNLTFDEDYMVVSIDIRLLNYLAYRSGQCRTIYS